MLLAGKGSVNRSLFGACEWPQVSRVCTSVYGGWAGVSGMVVIGCSFAVVDGVLMNALFPSEAKRFLLRFQGLADD